jgi:histidinol-phosphate phosphatase family protein
MKVVILAGGKGERLKPLTSSIPKALAPINGTPIIKLQIDSLASMGIREFIILTGYKASMVSTYLENVYRESDITIKCEETPPEFSPAARILAVKDQLDCEFLLLYCDNLVSDIEGIQRVINSQAKLTFLAEERLVGNMVVTPNVRYHINRSSSSPMVELGYFKVNCDSFIGILMKSESLPSAISEFSNQYKCAAIITSESLSSVSNILRFNEKRKNRKTILIDRDGVLNHKMPHREYLSRFEDYNLISANIEILSKLYSAQTDFIIITNQPGVATGQVRLDFLESLHDRLIVDLASRGISIIGVYVCPHHWNENCECRKPKPGMINQAITDYNLDRTKLVFIGDEQKDLDAAQNAKILGVLIDGVSNSKGTANTLDQLYTTVSDHLT